MGIAPRLISRLWVKWRYAIYSCTFEEGVKIGVVGQTGSGKTTLIGALFRMVETEEDKIIVDGIDISTIRRHDIRSHFRIIPQDPTLFNGIVRYNLDPLCQHTDQEIWERAKEIYFKERDPQRSCIPDSSNIERLRDFIKYVYVDRRLNS